MDRLKYRIWDKKKKKYLPQDDMVGLTCNGLAILIMQDGNVYRDALPDDFVVERCTGLKDKNGNLIYEGDIVEIQKKDWACTRHVVKWDEELLAWALYTQTQYIYDFYRLNPEDLEIVGNANKKGKK